jgi:hypothetical protein
LSQVELINAVYQDLHIVDALYNLFPRRQLHSLSVPILVEPEIFEDVIAQVLHVDHVL